jgi:hypothetical protein
MSVLKLQIIADPSGFRRGMNAVSKDLFKLQKTANTVGRGLNRALGAAGLAVGFAALTRVLKQSAKAASEDIKSQALLSNALKNTTGASDLAIKSAESYIRKTQLSAAVLDTELRPALSQAVRATGSLASGQALLDTALDVSAGTGKDLGSVVGALSKAYTGNTTSLKKLIPGIDVTGDYMGQLNKTFEGAAETAANNDPYKKISIIFGELQETIGMTLLPALQQFSEYLSSDEGQSNLQTIANIFGVIGTLITNATSFLIHNATIIMALVAGLVALKVGWFAVTAAVKLYELATKLAKIQTIALRTAIISTGIGALVVAVATLGAMWYSASQSVDEYAEAQDRAINPNQITFTDNGFSQYDPLTGIHERILRVNDELMRLKDLMADPRITQEMKRVLIGYKGKQVTIDFGMNAIFSNGKKVWQGVSKEVKEVAEQVREALDKEVGRVKSTAEKFRDAIGLAFGTRGEDENSIFNVDFLIGKMKRIAQAAKGFAENLASLRKRGADQSFINEIVAMGPAQGNIVAKSLLQSPGKLSEILGLRGEIYGVGAQAQVQSSIAGNATYEININKAVISASDIIREIKILEKKTGRKYLVN